MSLLTVIVFLPLIGAIGLALVPRDSRVLVRGIPLLITGLVALLSVIVFGRFDATVAGYQLVTVVPWFGAETLGINCRLGVDGLSVALILMGALVAFAATCVSWDIRERRKEYYSLLLLMTGGILGAFASLNLFFFYAFHELALVPTFIMIGVWGRGERKDFATFQITLYLSLGALIALAGLIALYLKAGAGTFDIDAMTAHLQVHPLSPLSQETLFPVLLIGFGILVSLWPFHSWAAPAYAAAPTGTAMLHAGVLKKFGLYGLLRVAVPMLPEGADAWFPALAVLALGNIIYCGFVAMRQRDLNYLIGYSSVAHMGFVFLGIATFNVVGMTGAVVVMVAHGFLAALSFALTGYLRSETKQLELGQLGGLLRQIPFAGGCLIMAMLAGCGLPGFANFIGEVTVFFGAWARYPVVTTFAVWGALVIGGVYMVRAIREIFHGPLADRWAGIRDVPNAWLRFPYLLLLACLLIFGFFPSLLTNRLALRMGPEAQATAASENLPSTGLDNSIAKATTEEVKR